ncbi:hypothetical protein J4710_04270 [Staphylococcus xylosus]|uniref:Uncharacterized protein n=1 Tax=Staphylococcus xylosus TaxID=1288 RepID=A0A939NC11_STAXY|nr:hypothetical protein [Staphylococcus xylosus]
MLMIISIAMTVMLQRTITVLRKRSCRRRWGCSYWCRCRRYAANKHQDKDNRNSNVDESQNDNQNQNESQQGDSKNGSKKKVLL